MEEYITAYQYRCIKILERLSGGMMSTNNYTSSDKAFFKTDNNCKLFEIGNDNLPEFPDGLNNSVILMYRLMGQLHKEVYLNQWTIMSLDESLQRYKKYCEEGQRNVFDIGYRYLGLGHIEVVSCDLSTHRLYYRPDGGSNDYDRYFNQQNMIKKGPIKDNQIFFSEWFY